MTCLSQSIKIDKNVILPPPNNIGLDRTIYPFGQMEVGDSFFLVIGVKKISSAAYHFGKRNEMKFSVRSEGKGCRVWRIA